MSGTQVDTGVVNTKSCLSFTQLQEEVDQLTRQLARTEEDNNLFHAIMDTSDIAEEAFAGNNLEASNNKIRKLKK